MTDEYSDFLLKYVSRQVDNLFPSFNDKVVFSKYSVLHAVRRTNHCISKIRAFERNHFDHMNSGHYATFLYYLSHYIWNAEGDKLAATKIFLLNKAINGIDLFYEIEMPSVFLIGHTVGMVFAKANYGSHCIFHQGCTIGRSKEHRPKLEPGVILYPNSSIIGQSHVRENTVLSPGVNLINTDTPGNCLVFSGKSGRPIFKEISEIYSSRYFLDSY
jgi:serine O-acetyltransferase